MTHWLTFYFQGWVSVWCNNMTMSLVVLGGEVGAGQNHFTLFVYIFQQSIDIPLLKPLVYCCVLILLNLSPNFHSYFLM